MSAWSKLPNAKCIDAVFASVKAHPEKWSKAWTKLGIWTQARAADWNAARSAAWNAADDAARSPAYDAAWNVSRDAAWNAAWNAIDNAVLALIAYDDCAHLLTTNPEHVKMMAGIGNEAAILLYPAVRALSETKNECLV